jgi:hypothetical protein
MARYWEDGSQEFRMEKLEMGDQELSDQGSGPDPFISWYVDIYRDIQMKPLFGDNSVY